MKAAEHSLFDNYRRAFFAIDRFPENEERFPFTFDDVLKDVAELRT